MADDDGAPDDDGSGDLAPEDMDDLGDLGDEDGDGPGDDGDDTEGEDGKPWKPPSRSQWERAQRRLKKYADERRAGKGADVDRKLQAQLRGKEDGDDDGADASAEAELWRSRAAASDASAQLTAAGFSGTAAQARRLTRLIDLAGAKPDRDGRFDFTDDIEELKEDYPELFGGRGSRRNERGRRQHTAPERGGTPTKSASERTTDRLLKEAGYR